MHELSRSDALRLASPYPYVLATVLNPQGRPNAIGLNRWTITSVSPLHVAIAVCKSRYTHECLEHSREFVLNFPSAEQAPGAWICGSRSGRRNDKLADSGLELIPSTRVAPPTILGSTLALECRIQQQLRTGDHTLYDAEVLAHRGNPDAPSHLYALHQERLVAIDHEGQTNWALQYR
jgi:flavin reductase (DIM6/NTAB) family NADH-FMN oxidoreductase RutF